MRFQTLPNYFDKINKHRWKIALGVISGVIFLIGLSYFTYRQSYTLEQTNDLINKSAHLKRVNNICENLPKPEDFRFVSKIISGNSYTSAISHYYRSKLEYSEVETFYLEWFNQNGWTLETEGTLDFRKNNLVIHIGKGYWARANYYIHCAEES